MSPMKLSVIVPFYNECESLARLESQLFPIVKQLPGHQFHLAEPIKDIEFVFVDDGSVDGSSDLLLDTFERVKKPELSTRLEMHDRNRGLGAALRTGFAAASGDVIITTDSDGTYRFETIPLLLDCLKPSIDIVTASPYHPDGEVVGVPTSRLILSRGSSLLYRILVDWEIHTYTALYRAYRKQVIKTVTFKSNDFLAGTELMVKAMLQGYRVAEFPAALHRRAYGVSKAKIMRTIQAHLAFQGQVLAHRLGLKSLNEKVGP